MRCITVLAISITCTVLITGCDRIEEGENKTTSSESTEVDSPDSINEIQVPVGFDWSMTHEILLNLTLLDVNNNPLSRQAVNIYQFPIVRKSNDEGVLLYSGLTSSSGKIQLKHKVRKENPLLYLRAVNYENSEYIKIDLSDDDVNDSEYSVTRAIYL
ncbi:MAG: hypothetical protein HRU20_23530 [Pseudomonadales bacterium]|nr:hypothetical protein [Pseudomonadales bacterium]